MGAFRPEGTYHVVVRVFLSAMVISLGAFATPAQASPATEDNLPVPNPQGEVANLRWPSHLGFTVGFASARFDWRHTEFSDPVGPLQMPGAMMRLDHAQAFGLEFALGYTGEYFRMRVGLGWYKPSDQPDLLPEVGPNTRVSRITMSQWFLEAGWAHRYGDITPFVVAHVGILRATADLDAPSLELRARRFALGPRAGLRAHFNRVVYLQADVFADVVNLGDHVITLGLGIGQR